MGSDSMTESLQNILWQKNFEDFGIDFDMPNEQKSILSTNIFGSQKEGAEYPYGVDSERSPLI